MHYGDNPYDGALGAIVGQVFFKPKGQADQEVIAKAKQDLNACFERLERELGSQDYLLGSQFHAGRYLFRYLGTALRPITNRDSRSLLASTSMV